VLGRDVQPGQRFQIAAFGINGPLSDPPANYIWIRSATLQFYRPEPLPAVGGVVRLDPALDGIMPADARIEKIAEGFAFTEGPVWDAMTGTLLFSDPNENAIYRWTEEGGVQVFRANSGYTGFDIGAYGQPGSNGLTFDHQGRLTIAEHGNHRISRLERNGVLTVLADRHQGKRLNSPNDLVYRSDGTLYFTDPPFGPPKFLDDPMKELPYSGVYSWRDGELRLEASELSGPNGVAFSPDERFLYVINWDPVKKVVMRYPVPPTAGSAPAKCSST
jgi:gluconolactonase